jgi:hypothetical protein
MNKLMIELTFVDKRYEQFVRLITFEFDSIEKLKIYWKMVPEIEGGSVFTADLHEGEGLTQSRDVPFDWIQEITGATIQDLIFLGRTAVRALGDRERERQSQQRPPHVARG